MFLAVSSRADRRRLPRMRLECTMAFRIEGSDEVHEGWARTVSGGGLSFETEAPLEPGTRVEITVDPPLRLTAPLTGVLEVRRCDPAQSRRGLPYVVAGPLEIKAPA
jgi:hypothetical protein